MVNGLALKRLGGGGEKDNDSYAQHDDQSVGHNLHP